MIIEDLVFLAKRYQNLGWAVQDQLDKYLVEESEEGLNPNAVRMFKDWINHAEELVEEIV